MLEKITDKITKFFKENYKFLILLIFIVTVFMVELPYKIYTPGGMVDLGKRIEVEGGYSSNGQLGMAYVSMVRGSIPYLLLSYVIPDWDIVPESELKHDNETMKEKIEADKIATKQSIDSAIISAYHMAGKPVDVDGEIVHITYIDKAAKTDLMILDTVISVDGVRVKSTAELKEIIKSHKEGDTISFNVLRNEKEITCYATVYNTNDGLKVGISLTVTYNYLEDPVANISMKQSESGPSGGLMMSLAIYNALVEEDITKSKKIIGTGTIDINGNVGEIGGVKYKLIGAVQKKADVFLVPEGNYEEVINIKNEKGYDIRIISVKNLEDAINELKKL